MVSRPVGRIEQAEYTPNSTLHQLNTTAVGAARDEEAATGERRLQSSIADAALLREEGGKAGKEGWTRMEMGGGGKAAGAGGGEEEEWFGVSAGGLRRW